MTGLEASNLARYGGLGDTVTGRIRNAILDGTLSDGQRLIERDVADSLGVSRGPVRDALRQLATEGLVVMLPRRGSHVASLTPNDGEEIMAIRRAIEPLAARFMCTGEPQTFPSLHAILERLRVACAAESASQMVLLDLALHRELYVLSGRRRLLTTWENISPPLLHIFGLNRRLYDTPEQLYENHRGLVERIERGIAPEAEAAVLEHVTKFQPRLLSVMSERAQAAESAHDEDDGWPDGAT